MHQPGPEAAAGCCRHAADSAEQSDHLQLHSRRESERKGIYENNLTGTIPASWTRLAGLSGIDIPYNPVRPPQLLHHFFQMDSQCRDISGSLLAGSLSHLLLAAMCQACDPAVVWQFTGTLPAFGGTTPMPRLWAFVLSYCPGLYGALPSSFTRCRGAGRPGPLVAALHAA